MLPVKKTSKCRTRKRRTHHALRPPNLVVCPKCNGPKRPHCACSTCGYASPSVGLPIKEKEG